MKHSRDSWLALGLFGLLALITAFAAVSQNRSQAMIPLDSSSNQPNGARALNLWLDQLGYRTSDTVQEEFAIPKNTRMIFMLEPSQPLADADWLVLDKWISDGGTLILAGDGFGASLASPHFNFTQNLLGTPAEALTSQTPLLSSPPISTPAQVTANSYLVTTRTDFVTQLAAPEGPVLVSFDVGQGHVWLSTTAYPFTNAGLKDPGNPALVLNLLASSDPTAVIWFDEWHHGRRASTVQAAGPSDWLLTTSAGRAVLLVAVVIFIALIWRGRRFGRPVPLPHDIARRAPLEYITAIANLNRRAGHRTQILRQYHLSLKRTLGFRYRLAPNTPDAQYAHQLAAYNPEIDEAALSALLSKLSRPKVSEAELIQLAAQVAEWTRHN